jgi:hypothetical protein
MADSYSTRGNVKGLDESDSNQEWPDSIEGENMKPPVARDFHNQLSGIKTAARQNGSAYVDVQSGNLHRIVGGYPDCPRANHRMPVCCSVMKTMMGRTISL